MNLMKPVYSALKVLSSCMQKRVMNLGNVEYIKTGYKKDNTPPENGYLPYIEDTILKGKDSHYWFRATFETPSVCNNEYLVLRATTGKEQQDIALNPQGLLYLNGKMVQGLDSRHTDAYIEPNTKYLAHNYFYLSDIERLVGFNMAIYSINDRVEKLYYDIKVPFDCLEFMSVYSDEYSKILPALVECTRILDLRDTTSESFFDSVEKAISFMENRFYGEICSTSGKPVVNCIGNTHIDVEWLWARAQTREKIQRSFSTAKALMDKYPEYKFMLSQPELYRYLKEEAPEKYQELKQLVIDGRWEPEGAMYLEPDCNLTSGESLVRQIMHGKKFFRDEFGVDCKILFLPDVFGYSAALPQILRKSGVDYFVTSKIGWNDTNQMPNDTFYWEGIDGTEIFTSFITSQDYVRDESKKSRFTTYVGNITPTRIKGTWDRFSNKQYADVTLMTFGYGDGGGGPTKEMLETNRRLEKGIPGMPVTKIGFLRDFLSEHKAKFDNACESLAKTPKWVGELYLELHRGTYTSIAKIKKNNRKAEFLLGNAEVLSATHSLFGGNSDLDKLNFLWRKTLHNQFHDILPGSSIKEVYDNTDKDYEIISTGGNDIVNEKLSFIISNLKTDGGVFLYNPTSFERPAVITASGEYLECNNTVKPFGWSVINPNLIKNKVKISNLTAENDYYVLTLNKKGEIESLYDKRAKRQVFKNNEVGNRLLVFSDNPIMLDAWEIDDYYTQNQKVIDNDALISPVTDGTRSGFVIERSYKNSKFKQTIWLYSQSTRIDFENDIDWHEHHQIIKAEFPIDVHATTANYDVQFGYVTRPTHSNTSWEEAKFEVCAHKWADVSENGYGVALLNDSKYGYSCKRSDLSLTLLKGATYPYADADQGKHTFTYSLMPHIGDFRDAGVIEESFALNQPLIERNAIKSNGTLPEEFSLVSVDCNNIVITAVKPCEKDNGLIVRLYETHDKKSNITLTAPNNFKKAYLCDLLENELSPLEFSNGKTTLSISNFEIVTIKFTI